MSFMFIVGGRSVLCEALSEIGQSPFPLPLPSACPLKYIPHASIPPQVRVFLVARHAFLVRTPLIHHPSR